MQYIKLFFISIIFIFLLFTGISLFIPSQINISRAINLAASQDKILDKIKDTSSWAAWYPGYNEMKVKGTTVTFTGEKENELNAEFKSRAKKIIATTWRTIPFPQSDSITLQWNLQFNLRWYPWEKFGSLLYEKSYGQQLEQALLNLKND